MYDEHFSDLVILHHFEGELTEVLVIAPQTP